MDQLTMSLEAPGSERAVPPAPPRAASPDSVRHRLARLLESMKQAECSEWSDEADVRLWTRLFEATVERLPQDEAPGWTRAFQSELRRLTSPEAVAQSA